MTYLIHARNVNDALEAGAHLLRSCGHPIPSRYGDTLEVPGPVTTEYSHPMERVLFNAARNANPIFHLMDALWVLAGRQDVRTLAFFNQRMASFADPDAPDIFHAPYGYRMRRAAGQDQLQEAGKMLRRDPGTRRAVVSIWNPRLDLAQHYNDIPCNDLLVFRIDPVTGALGLHLTARSNDLVWGTYGANPVQFGFVLEYVAALAALPPGRLVQTSVSFHAYTKTFDPQAGDAATRSEDIYPQVKVHPLFVDGEGPEAFQRDLSLFWEHLERQMVTGTRLPPPPLRTAFLQTVAYPMAEVYLHRRIALMPWARARELFTAATGAVRWIDWIAATDLWLARKAEAV